MTVAPIAARTASTPVRQDTVVRHARFTDRSIAVAATAKGPSKGVVVRVTTDGRPQPTVYPEPHRSWG